MKKCLFLALCAWPALEAWAFFVYEPFNYPAGAGLIGQTNPSGSVWLPAGPAGAPPKVRLGGLAFSSLAVPTGNMIESMAAVGPSARLRLGTSVTNGPLYFSLVMRIIDPAGLQGEGSDIGGFSPGDTAQTLTPDLLGARIFIRPAVGGYTVGLTKTSTSVVEVAWDRRVLGTNDTVLLVGKYALGAASPNDDQASLWVYRDGDALSGKVEPAPLMASGAGPDLPRIASFVLLQRPAPAQPAFMRLDELRVGMTWAEVVPVSETEPGVLWDFGDAPAAYGVWLADNGARHRVGPLFFGTRVDAESDGQPSPNCIGDDLNGTANDEDGISLLAPIALGRPAVFQVIASGRGLLSAWMDFNRDGRWQAAERVFHGEPLVAGTNLLNLVVPAQMQPGFVVARWRLASQRVDDPNGPAEDGEVQDVRFMVRGEKLLPRLASDQTNGVPRIIWNQPDSVLEEADEVEGPWRPMRGAMPGFSPSGSGPRKFYRLRAQPDADDIGGLLRKAELVFDGVVTEVRYRNSDVNSEQTNSLPFTFVTFAVNEVLKGRVEGTNFCLRLIGGPNGRGDILKVGGAVDFDVGQRCVLFISGNGRLVNPVVGQERGRFRLVNGALYTNRGREVHWRPDGTVAFGPRRDLDEVLFQALRGQARPPFTAPADDDGVALVDRPGEHLDRARFRTVLTALLEQGHTPEELKGAAPVPSCDIQQPFYAPRFIPRKPGAPGGN